MDIDREEMNKRLEKIEERQKQENKMDVFTLILIILLFIVLYSAGFCIAYYLFELTVVISLIAAPGLMLALYLLFKIGAIWDIF